MNIHIFRWKKVNVMAEAWVKRMDEMIKMWEKQAATADKVYNIVIISSNNKIAGVISIFLFVYL